jgi:hypothetical protein
MKVKTAVIRVIIPIMICAGCSNDAEYQDRLSKIEDDLIKLQSKIERLPKNVATKFDFELCEGLIQEITSKSATVYPDRKEFSFCRNEYGAFPVTIEDVQPYLDGYKVQMCIGNLTAAQMNNVVIHVDYGPRVRDFQPGKGKEIMEQYLESARINSERKQSLSVNVTKSLPAASWTSFEVIIVHVSAEDIGQLEVGLDIKGIGLSIK